MPPAPRARRGGSGILIAVIAVVLVVAVGGGVVWAVSESGAVEFSFSGGGGGGDLKIAWAKETEQERLPGGSGPIPETYATWLTEELVVRASTDGVAAYRLTDGTQAWTVPLPDGAQMCTAAATASGGHGVIAYGGRRCDRLGMIDLRAGKLARTVRVPTPKNAGKRPAETRLVVAGDMAVLDDEGAMTAFGISDGKQRWRQEDGDCSGDVWAMGDKRIVSERRCISKRGMFVAAIDPATGRDLSETFMGEMAVVLNVVSTDPVVLVIGPSPSGPPIPQVVVLDPQGKKTTEIPSQAAGRNLLAFGTTGLTSSAAINQPAMFTRDNTLFAVNKAASPWSMVAFDLTTGKQLWTEKDNQGETKIIRVDDRGVWAVQTSSGDGHLVVTDPKTGETSVVRKGGLTPDWSSIKSSQVFEYRETLVVTPTSRKIDVVPSLVVLR